jgi:cytidylate kinase
MTFDEARGAVEQLDRERAKFIQRHFGVDVADSTKHDIVINRELFGLDQTVELILAARKLTGLAQKRDAARRYRSAFKC